MQKMQNQMENSCESPESYSEHNEDEEKEEEQDEEGHYSNNQFDDDKEISTMISKMTY